MVSRIQCHAWSGLRAANDDSNMSVDFEARSGIKSASSRHCGWWWNANKPEPCGHD